MNRSVLNRTLLNTSVLCQSRLNQSGLASLCGKAGGIPAAIRSAMVLWYDIARQGCSNETMQENPVLRDLSGNGHDAICYNFGWSGMSGVGGYDFPNLEVWTENTSVIVNVIKANKVSLSSSGGTSGIRQAFSKDTTLKLHISDINPATPVLVYRLHGGDIGNELLYTITEEGDCTVELAYNPDDAYNMVLLSGEATFEQLPLYPGAIVSDGVDDYAYVEGLSILTKEEGYTVVAKRKWLNEDGGGSSSLASKATNGHGNDGAFMFEYKEGDGKSKKTKSFGGNISLDDVGFAKGDVVYQTSISYNGKALNPGSYADKEKMVLFRFGTDESKYYGQFALYSFLLFSRDLTAEEIEWVKTNLIIV